jgi:hypothetical protein
MKSLKNSTSIRQVRVDHMLNITPQPANTCPLIDPLIYKGSSRSPLYNTNIEFDPQYLILNESKLIDRISELEQWGSDVLDVYSIIDPSTIDSDDINDMDNFKLLIQSGIANNKNYEISSMVSTINKIIYDWQDMHSSYSKLDSELDSVQKILDSLERNFDYEEDDDEYEDAVQSIKQAEEDIETIKENIEELKSTFDSDVVNFFEKEIDTFTVLMESVRSNNDNLRHNVMYLRELAIEYVNNEFNLVQPMDYLKKIESGRADEISLGLVDTRYYSYSFGKITDYLQSHSVINEVQSLLLKKSSNIDDLLDALNDAGYTKIRYYDDYKTSITQPELYKEVNFLKDTLKNNIQKIKV